MNEIAHIVALMKRQGISMVLVEQNIRLALAVADRILILREGRVTQDIAATGAEEEDIVRRIYL